MKVVLSSLSDGGFVDPIEVAEGTELAAFLEKQRPGTDWNDMMIRVNGESAASSRILQEDDRVAIAPVKITGANR